MAANRGEKGSRGHEKRNIHYRGAEKRECKEGMVEENGRKPGHQQVFEGVTSEQF